MDKGGLCPPFSFGYVEKYIDKWIVYRYNI